MRRGKAPRYRASGTSGVSLSQLDRVGQQMRLHLKGPNLAQGMIDALPSQDDPLPGCGMGSRTPASCKVRGRRPQRAPWASGG